MTVELKFATLPAPLGLLAAHYWFNVHEPLAGRCDRWEVWQAPNAGGRSAGHLHCNLKAPEDGVGGGPARLAAQWQGADALRLKAILEEAQTRYPFCDHYAPWPGPNSNTFVAWVLRRAGIDFRLPWNAIGRNYKWQDG